MTPESAFQHWLDAWWLQHHPNGGGSPPTLQDAFLAGRKDAHQPLLDPPSPNQVTQRQQISMPVWWDVNRPV